MSSLDADLERRFGGLRRLHGVAAYERLRAARIAVIGVGGVGSWAAEALARSGVAALTLIDLDHIAESNINRQIHAIEPTLGQAKVQALKDRIALIHPGCIVTPIEEFVDEANVGQLLSADQVDVVLDCCDQVKAKAALAAWAKVHGRPVVTVGAAGGKTKPQLVEVADLSEVTHDPLLASLRQRLRQRHEGARKGAMRGSLAQSVEQRTFNPLVACSSHARPTTR
jgi:tRNA A37 threonylcarbamoyladenosine dehydratase